MCLPARTNLIALSLYRVLSVKDNVVEIDKIDAFTNTPILDLKPYIPDYDSANASVPGWLMNHKKTIDKDAGRSDEQTDSLDKKLLCFFLARSLIYGANPKSAKNFVKLPKK